MSAALVERVAEVPVTETPKTLSLVPEPSEAKLEQEKSNDPHPLVPMFIMGAISVAGALAFIGMILAWLALRPTGLNAPF